MSTDRLEKAFGRLRPGDVLWEAPAALAERAARRRRRRVVGGAVLGAAAVVAVTVTVPLAAGADPGRPGWPLAADPGRPA